MLKQNYDLFMARSRPVFYHKHWHRYGLKALKDLALTNFKLLDIGCGNGEFSQMARQHFNAEVTCMDYADSHLEKVRALGFDTVRCDLDSAQDLARIQNSLKNSFDIVAAFEVIEHLFDVDTFLSTTHGLLKDGGWLLISTPNLAYFRYRLYALLGGNMPVSEGHHIRFFNPRKLLQFLFVNGFDLVADYSHGEQFDRVYDYSAGNFVYYLDELAGEDKSSLRAFCIRTLFKICSILIPKSSPAYCHTTIFLMKKAAVAPLGISPLARNARYERLSAQEKKLALGRLLSQRDKLFFNEYPGLRKFIAEQAESLALTSRPD